MPSKELVPRPAVQPPAAIPAPPFEQQKPRTESGARLLGRALRRNRHVTVPLAVPLVLWLAALILHAQRPGIRIPAAVLLLTVAACVWCFAPHKWDRTAEQWYARLSAALAALWLVLAAWLGPLGGFAVSVAFGSVLFACASVWGWFWWKHHRPRGRRKRESLIAKWDIWWQSHAWAWNLGGSAIVNVWLMGVTTKVEVAGIAGRHSLAHVNQVIALIESGLDGHVDVGRVRAETVPEQPNHFYLYFKQANPLAEVVEYDMGIAPRSVHDPAPLGISEAGAWKMTSLRCNSFTLGRPAAARPTTCWSGWPTSRAAPTTARCSSTLKGGRSARPVLEAGGADYVVTNVDEARMTC